MSETSTPTTPDSPYETMGQPAQPIAQPAPAESLPNLDQIQDVEAQQQHAAQRQLPRKTRKSEILKYAASILILVAGAGAAKKIASLKEKPPEGESNALVPMVETVKAVPYLGVLDKQISGTVIPYREIRVAAEVNGQVIRKSDAFEAGNYVNQGELLLEIDPEDYKFQKQTGIAEVNQAEKMLEETKKEKAGAKLILTNAKKEYELALEDHEQNKKIRTSLSKSEFKQSERSLLAADSARINQQHNKEVLEARSERLEASLKLAEAKLARIQFSLDKTKVYAPCDGVIVREMVQKGDFVRAGDELVMFEDISRSEVICNLTATDLKWIRDNAPEDTVKQESNLPDDMFSVYQIPRTAVSVFEVSEPNIVWEGVLERFDGIGRDESTRTIPCRITINNPIVVDEESGTRRALVRGMYVKCRIEVQASADNAQRKFVEIPATAIRSDKSVWVERDLKIWNVPVDVVHYTEKLIGEKKTKMVVVVSSEDSIQPGDSIVRTPIAQPSNQMEVMLASKSGTEASVEKTDDE